MSAIIFDRQVIKKHRNRASHLIEKHNFLFKELASVMVNRLCDIQRSFSIAVDLGCHNGEIGSVLTAQGFPLQHLIQSDFAVAMSKKAESNAKNFSFPTSTIVADDEALPFVPYSVDLILSCLSLHWVNDLPGVLIQIQRSLKPDGLFLAALLGGGTLQELRHAFFVAETEIYGGASPRISPLINSQTAAYLMQRGRFLLPVVDSDKFTVTYPNPFELMYDLRGMGETNALIERSSSFMSRHLLERTIELYSSIFGDDKGRIPATFEVLYLTGWGQGVK